MSKTAYTDNAGGEMQILNGMDMERFHKEIEAAMKEELEFFKGDTAFIEKEENGQKWILVRA